MTSTWTYKLRKARIKDSESTSFQVIPLRRNTYSIIYPLAASLVSAPLNSYFLQRLLNWNYNHQPSHNHRRHDSKSAHIWWYWWVVAWLDAKATGDQTTWHRLSWTGPLSFIYIRSTGAEIKGLDRRVGRYLWFTRDWRVEDSRTWTPKFSSAEDHALS